MRSNVKTELGKSSQIFLNQTDTPKPVELPCRYHTGSICLNYCHQFQCFRLLCQQCIEEHLEHHKKASLSALSIKSLKKVREFCVNKLNVLLQELCLNMNHLKQPKNPQQIIEQVNFKFEKVKTVMFKIIQQQLNRFQQQIRNKVNQSFSTIKNLQDIHANLEKIIKQLAESKGVIIDGTRQMPDVVEKVLAMDSQVYRQSFGREVEVYSQKLSMIQFDISLNQGAFQNSVNQCLKICKNQYKSEFEDISVSRSRSQPKNKNMSLSSFEEDTNSTPIPSLESPIPLLHFFQTCEPYLHLIDISTLGKGNNSVKHNIINLSTPEYPYYVPDFHASFLSELGYIFISGGIIGGEEQQEDSSAKSNIMSKFSLKEQKFKRQFCKIIPRSSHSMVEADGFVYILGGYGQATGDGVEIEYSFQQVNIKSGEVINLPKSNYGGANFSSISYPYIIKASQQGIQMYSLPNNSWAPIRNLNSPYNFYRQCGYSKISNGSILIYGGYELRNEEGMNSCYQWLIENNNNLNPNILNNSSTISVAIKQLKGIKLPQKSGFRSNPGVIKNGILYVLQNIDDPQYGVVENQRNLLSFNGQKWMKIKY